MYRMEPRGTVLAVCMILLSLWMRSVDCNSISKNDDSIQSIKPDHSSTVTRLQAPIKATHVRIPFFKRRFVGTGLVRPKAVDLSPEQKFLYHVLTNLYRNRKRTDRKYGAEAWCQTQECIDHMINLEQNYPEVVGDFGRR